MRLLWNGRCSYVVVQLVVDRGRGLGIVGACVVLSSVGEVHAGGAAEGWLLWDAVRKVAVRRCRMWCLMLVVGGCESAWAMTEWVALVHVDGGWLGEAGLWARRTL
jgi:hypothetical protein